MLKTSTPVPPRHGVARVLSKAGLASRSQAAAWVREGRVSVSGRVVRDPEYPVRAGIDEVCVDGKAVTAEARVYLALNKPRGLVTSVSDEKGRDTVYRCFEAAGLPWIAPVGRLDQASEGLLLFTNDPAWAAHITDPATGPDKTYRVQVQGVPGDDALAAMVAGGDDGGEWLSAKAVTLLKSGGKTAWLEITLDEGRNRQIRRLTKAAGFPVLRLVRVAIGPLALGGLAKGAWRPLTPDEVLALSRR
ncbi:MAG TPA: pseudouridine synthase [Xanthomonadaceae bacterium]|jgi:23S rRNA pseudouridine2605 synthase|nr:pseudouridine synthase [Xanthomonadaceae bacterium]